MALPVNIEDLVHGNTVEWERLEFKKGWNPEDVIHCMCAFANDIHNWGGGYIIIGMAENKGQPVFPPVGIHQNQLDAIQGEIIRLGYQIQPNYFPIVQPYRLNDQHILVLWCPAGDNRPYTAPDTFVNGSLRMPYIRIGSRNIVAKGENLRQLHELTARIPFDDRINNQAKIDDFDLGTIQAYLQEIKSDLYIESTKMPLVELCRMMYIAKGPDEDLHPVNVGLLFFCKQPERFFPRAWVELVWHKDGSGRNFKEFYFKGPLHHQLRAALSFLESNIISEQVIKYPNKAEADRVVNFPYEAVEEALSNSVYHKSYEISSPIEVQVWPDKIEILSFPGPIPPVNAEILKNQRRIVSREYRNRRIGDFLKELRLTEGRGTGFPAIYNAMENNGSPKPVFETDEQSTHVLVTLPVHQLALTDKQTSDQVRTQGGDQVNDLVFKCLEDILVFTNQAGDQAGDQALVILSDDVHQRVAEVLQILLEKMKRIELFERMKLSNHSKNRQRYLDPLINLGWVEMEFPNKKTTPSQRYQITNSGRKLLKLLQSV